MKPTTNSSSKFYQGKYRVKYPSKYSGSISDVVYRSSWEAKFMVWCDHNPNVVSWASETVVIPYISPVDGRPHRYFVDFYVKIQDRNGVVKGFLVEVKPKKQTIPPQQQKKTKRFIQEALTYEVNQAKWNAASKYCEERGMQFLVLTEDHLKV